MSLTARRELERLLEPISPRAFFEESWEKKPLHVPGRPGKLAHVGFDRATFWKTVRELPDDAKCLRAIYHDAAGRHQEILELEPRMAEALFDSGMTIVFTQLEDHCEAVRELLVGLRAGMNLPGHITVGCFFSPEDHGAGLHYDNHSAIVLQLEGRKRWQVSKRPALEFPPRNYGYETDAALVERNARSPGLATELPVPDDFLEVELAPGDVFYMPPGTWHRPRATGGAGSLALTLGPFVKNPLQLVCEHLSRGLGERLEWRRSLPVGPASEGSLAGVPEELETFLEKRLADLRAYVGAIRPRDLARLWHSGVAPPPALSLEELARERRPVAPAERIFLDRTRRVSTLAARDDTGEEKVFLYLDGEEIDFPATARVFLESLLARDSFVAEEARKWVPATDEPYDWEDVREILRVLLSRGLLHRRDPARAS